MERPADDIFLINDLTVLQSPVSRHLFLGRSSDASSVGSPASVGLPNTKPTRSTLSNSDENKRNHSEQSVEVPVKRKRGRPPKNKSVEPSPLGKRAVEVPVVPSASAVVPVEAAIAVTATATPATVTAQTDTQTTNGNNPKVITLSDWSLATVPNSAKLTGVPTDVRSLWVVLVGRRHDMVEAWHSSIVTERILANHIKTGSGRSLYILEAPMNVAEMQANGFSDSFIGAFKNGFPENWRTLLMAELERLGKSVKQQQQQQQQQQQPSDNKQSVPVADNNTPPVKRGPGRPKKTPTTPQDHKQDPKTTNKTEKTPTIEELIESKKRQHMPAPSNLAVSGSVEEQINELVNDSLTISTGDDTKQDPVVPVKRGRGRPKKNPNGIPGVSPTPSDSKPSAAKLEKKKKKKSKFADDAAAIYSSPPLLPATHTSSRRRSGNAPTIKWGWGGKAVIQTDADNQR